MSKTIFITIPAYEDAQLLETIEGAINNAKHPENLYFAIALQYKNVPMPNVKKYFNSPNFNFVSYDVDGRPGVNKVRHNLSKFYKNQDYFLMIDSHSNFMNSWDEILIDEYNKITKDVENKNIIISHIPNLHAGIHCSCYNSNDICNSLHRCSFYSIDLEKEIFEKEDGRIIFQAPKFIYRPMADSGNTNYEPAKIVAAGFFFTQGKWIDEVGIVDGLQIIYEEQMLSFRSYIAGWDIYRLKNIDVIGHNNKKYNIEVYGEENPSKTLTGTIESPDIYDQLELCMILNKGKFRISAQKRLPEEFWFSIGLGSVYEYYFDVIKMKKLYLKKLKNSVEKRYKKLKRNNNRQPIGSWPVDLNI